MTAALRIDRASAGQFALPSGHSDFVKQQLENRKRIIRLKVAEVPARRTKKALGAVQEISAGWVLQWMAEWVKDCRPAPNT